MPRFRSFRCAATVSASGFILGLCPYAWAEAVVFTDSRHHMTLVGSVRVVALDAPKQIEAVLSEGLPPDASKAAVIIRQRLAQNPAIHQQLAVAHQGVLDAFSLGVTKIPAVVVDRRFVVYGEHDVEAALAKIATYRNGVQLE